MPGTTYQPGLGFATKYRFWHLRPAFSLTFSSPSHLLSRDLFRQQHLSLDAVSSADFSLLALLFSKIDLLLAAMDMDMAIPILLRHLNYKDGQACSITTPHYWLTRLNWAWYYLRQHILLIIPGGLPWTAAARIGISGGTPRLLVLSGSNISSEHLYLVPSLTQTDQADFKHLPVDLLLDMPVCGTCGHSLGPGQADRRAAALWTSMQPHF